MTLIAGISLALAMVAGTPGVARAGGAAGCHADRITDGMTAAIDMVDSCFTPAVNRVRAGTTITWTNRDAVSHAVTGAARSFEGRRTLGTGETISARFDRPGVYPYYCPMHPSMVGAVLVGEAGTDGPVAFAALSDAGARDVGASLPWLALGLAAGAAGAAGAGAMTGRLRRTR